jgi:hypothetical protein
MKSNMYFTQLVDELVSTLKSNNKTIADIVQAFKDSASSMGGENFIDLNLVGEKLELPDDFFRRALGIKKRPPASNCVSV